MYRTVRDKNPLLPIILVSKPDFHLESMAENLRRATIMETYIKARRDGDVNIHFVDGAALFGRYSKGECTIDGTHPTDLGFRLMAELVGRTLEDAIKYREEQKN